MLRARAIDFDDEDLRDGEWEFLEDEEDEPEGFEDTIDLMRITDNDEWHYWKAGKILLFDDSYEHEIRNDTNEVRIVLLLRLWHPALGPQRRRRELLPAR